MPREAGDPAWLRKDLELRASNIARLGPVHHAWAATFAAEAARLRELTGKHVLEHRLADQLVPEGVAVGVADHYVGVDGRTQGGRQGRVIEPGHRGKQRVTKPRAAHGGDPQRLLCPLGQHLTAACSRSRKDDGSPGLSVPSEFTRASVSSGTPPPR